MAVFKIKQSEKFNEHYPYGQIRMRIKAYANNGDVDMEFWPGKAVIHDGMRTVVFEKKNHAPSDTIWLDYKETIM